MAERAVGSGRGWIMRLHREKSIILERRRLVPREALEDPGRHPGGEGSSQQMSEPAKKGPEWTLAPSQGTGWVQRETTGSKRNGPDFHGVTEFKKLCKTGKGRGRFG